MMNRHPSLTAIILTAVILVPFAGCVGEDEKSSDPTAPSNTTSPPNWAIGEWWTYSFRSDTYEGHSTKLVVADTVASDAAHMLGISSEKEAQRHAVLNHNPFLGRITLAERGVYENGSLQSVFHFPMTYGETWSFDLLGKTGWKASVEKIELTPEGEKITVQATSSSGDKMTYVWSQGAGFIESFRVENSGGELLTEMQLTEFGTNHSGVVWFLRGSDLYEGAWTSSAGDPKIETEITFLDAGHPRDGEFDTLVFQIIAQTGSDGIGTLLLQDPTRATVLERNWEFGESENGHDSIESTNGDYNMQITLTGSVYLNFMISGAVSYSWTLE